MPTVIDGFIIEETDFRDMPKAQDFAKLLPDVGRAAVQSGLGLATVVLATHQRVVNFCLTQVCRDVNRCDRDEPDARVFESPDQQVRYLLVDGFGHPLCSL